MEDIITSNFGKFVLGEPEPTWNIRKGWALQPGSELLQNFLTEG
jgi:hypothetical protein